MGKKRIIKKTGQDFAGKTAGNSRVPKKRLEQAVLHVEATYNNTKLNLTDTDGNSLVWSSSGSLGYTGSKKGTPFAASKVGDIIADKAIGMGIKDVEVIIHGVGAGREGAMRAVAAKGISISSIKDRTPVPFNGPRAPKPRRV